MYCSIKLHRKEQLFFSFSLILIGAGVEPMEETGGEENAAA